MMTWRVLASFLFFCWGLTPLGSIPAAGAEDIGDWRGMSRRVDQRIEERLRTEGLEPAPLATDSDFLRRVYLDLTGVIPRVAEARSFLDDARETKREEQIERLLASPAHATHLANTWRNIMLPGSLDPEQLANVAGVQNWLRTQFINRLRYDRLVSDLLVTRGGGDAGPALYYTSLELKPEKIAGSTARIFLGLQMECAECHDHPFDHWKQEDFWGYAAFFARLKASDQPALGNRASLQDADAGEVRIPGTEQEVAPKFPGGRAPEAVPGGTRRVQLAIWMGGRDNPYLARAAVNRVWAHLFGRGLVEPVDDLGDHNPPSHPQLLEELTQFFVEHDYDLHQLYRVLANTQTYQRTCEWSGMPPAPALFAVMPLKTLTAEQLYDSLRRLGTVSSDSYAGNLPSRAFDARRLAFVSRLQTQGRSLLEYHLGVPQALTLLNGNEVGELTNAAESALVRGLQAPWLTDEERLEVLFLAVLSRRPTGVEREQFATYLSEQSAQRPEALADMLWALLNSAEFAFNH